MPRKWHVLQTALAGKRLRELDAEVRALTFHPHTYTPLVLTERFPRHRPGMSRSRVKRVQAVEPIFQPYLFVEFDAATEPWQKITSLDGALSFLGYREGKLAPEAVRPIVMSELMARLPAHANHVTSRPSRIKRDQLVRILFGPFADFTATVNAVRKSGVEVLVELFGRPTPIMLDSLDLAPAA